MSDCCEMSNHAFRLRIEPGRVALSDPVTGFLWSEAAYGYRVSRPHAEGVLVHEKLQSAVVSRRDRSVVTSGVLAGLRVEHEFTLPSDRPIMEERVTLENASDAPIALVDLEFGFERRLTDAIGRTLPELSGDRFVAVPFRIRPSDPPGHVNDFGVGDLVTKVGGEMRQNEDFAHGMLPSRHRCSEGWVWGRGECALGLYKFNQEGMEFSVLSTLVREDGLWLRFGGACMVSGEPAAWCVVAPGGKLEPGVMRYHRVDGGYGPPAAYAFREMLDEMGCRFPRGYDPPVHWNELYDNPEFSLTTPADPAVARVGREKTRAVTYTRELIEQEAVKAKQYACEALYLDPGWDTAFGSFLWDEARLGSPRLFVEQMKDRHGLAVSLHCPLATWMSHALFRLDEAGPASWPRESWRKDAQGRLVQGSVCLGSRAYLDGSVERLVALCAEGVAFLMFDGTRWNGGCWNTDHGHPVPYSREDHVRANLELAQRIHARFPHVLIEMHDMVSGGTTDRRTPVYYKYGLPGSYDENWGFELMWNPFQDLREGRARALYYYNLGCNVPVYLHVDLRDDNEHCLVLWWFASTCRHLGIGGTHASPAVVASQKEAMARYRRLERFYKRGEFRGISEEIHLHVLREEDAFVVNIFNLSDTRRRITGSVAVGDLGVAADRWYVRSERWAGFDRGRLVVGVELEPWGTQVVECHAIQVAGGR